MARLIEDLILQKETAGSHWHVGSIDGVHLKTFEVIANPEPQAPKYSN